MADSNYQGGNDTLLNSFYGGILNTLSRNRSNAGKQRALEQKQMQDINKELQTTIAKVNPNGLQQKDVKEFSEIYEGIKDLNFQATKAKSPTEARELQAEIQNRITQANLFINQSKERGQEILKRADFVDKNKWMLTDASREQLKKLQETPTSQLLPDDYAQSHFERQPDIPRIDKQLEGVFKEFRDAAKNSPELRNITQTDITAGNKRGVRFQEMAKARTGGVIERIKQLYNADGELKAYYDNRAKQENLPAEAIITRDVLDANKGNKLSWMGTARETYNNVPRKSGSGGSGSGAGTGEAIRMSIPYNDGKNTDNVVSEDYVPITKSKANFAGSPVVSMTSGKTSTPLRSSADYEIVGIGNFPVMKNMRDKNLNNALAQPNYVSSRKEGEGYERKPMVHVRYKTKIGTSEFTEDGLVPYDRLPANIKNSKAIREALGKFVPAAAKATPQPTAIKKSTTKTPKASPKGLQKGSLDSI